MTNTGNAILSKYSPITAFFRCLFSAAKLISPMNWLSLMCPLFASRAKLTKRQIRSSSFTIRRARAIETYIVAWVGLEFAIGVVSVQEGLPMPLTTVLSIIAFIRILEIMQVTVNATLFDALSGRPDDVVASRTRMIVLAGLNFFELWLCFGIVYAESFRLLVNATQPSAAFYFSIITQLTIGYGDIYPSGWLRGVVAAQGLTTVVFVTFVIGRLISSLPSMHGHFRER